MIDERTEHLITRRLDGELAEGESLELDKQLIRSTEAREAFEETQRIEALAAATLHTLLHDKAPSIKPADRLPARPGGVPWTRRLLDGLIGVAAAVLLILIGSSLLPGTAPQDRPGAEQPRGLQLADQLPSPPGPGPAPQYREYRVADPPAAADLIAGPRWQHERIDREVIGVVDPETQSVYLLELQTARNTVSSLRANY